VLLIAQSEFSLPFYPGVEPFPACLVFLFQAISLFSSFFCELLERNQPECPDETSELSVSLTVLRPMTHSALQASFPLFPLPPSLFHTSHNPSPWTSQLEPDPQTREGRQLACLAKDPWPLQPPHERPAFTLPPQPVPLFIRSRPRPRLPSILLNRLPPPPWLKNCAYFA